MANSTLHLIVDRGPKQGETLARTAGTQVRIGRVVKGNTFPIRDTGISQKQLTIEFDSEIARWTVKDLDTSNGTFINDARIPSSIPFPLSDGDNLKIGEATSISIKIDGAGEADGGLRRGRGRAARSRTETLDSVAEVEDNEGAERNAEVRVEEPKNRGSGRPRRGNSTRASKKDEILDAAVDDSVEVRPRRAGVRTRAASARISKEEGASEGNADVGSMRVTKKRELPNSGVEDSNEATENLNRGRAKRACPRTRSSSAKAPPADELRQCDSVAEEEVSEKGDERNIADASKEVGSGEGEEHKSVEEETVVDFEKMTFGEWFDSMEKLLPQAVNVVAEQMIAILREKARLFDEYVNDGQLL